MRKICPRCGVEKDEQDYYKCNGRAVPPCKACRKETYQKKVETLEPVDFIGDLTCTVCGKTMPESQFSRNRMSPNGRAARCKECANAYTAGYHRAHHVPAPPLPAILPTYSGSTKACGRCKELKPVSDFGTDISRPSGLASYCRECSNAAGRVSWVLTKGTTSRQKRVNAVPRGQRAEEWERRSARHQVYEANQARLGAEKLFKKLEQRMFAPEREQAERDRRDERDRRRAAKETERLAKQLLWEAGAEERKRKNREAEKRREQRARHRRRQAVLDGYGSKCACCGETERNLLSLDHIHGGGKKDRQQRTNQKIYQDIIRRGFPKDEFQILCYNCNMAKGIYGICPHKLDIYRKPWIAASLPRRRAA